VAVNRGRFQPPKASCFTILNLPFEEPDSGSAAHAASSIRSTNKRFSDDPQGVDFSARSISTAAGRPAEAHAHRLASGEVSTELRWSSAAVKFAHVNPSRVVKASWAWMGG